MWCLKRFYLRLVHDSRAPHGSRVRDLQTDLDVGFEERDTQTGVTRLQPNMEKCQTSRTQRKT